MTNSRSNFSSMYQTIQCNLCDDLVDQTDSHLLDCKTIIANCQSLATNYEAEYEDIFGDIDSQLKITKLFKEVFKVKAQLDENIST